MVQLPYNGPFLFILFYLPTDRIVVAMKLTHPLSILTRFTGFSILKSQFKKQVNILFVHWVFLIYRESIGIT